jgi:membrane protein
LREFAYFNAMYGTLASFIVLMVWLQFTAMAILLGAELNVQVESLKQESAASERTDRLPAPAANRQAARSAAP